MLNLIHECRSQFLEEYGVGFDDSSLALFRRSSLLKFIDTDLRRYPWFLPNHFQTQTHHFLIQALLFQSSASLIIANQSTSNRRDSRWISNPSLFRKTPLEFSKIQPPCFFLGFQKHAFNRRVFSYLFLHHVSLLLASFRYHENARRDVCNATFNNSLTAISDSRSRTSYHHPLDAMKKVI